MSKREYLTPPEFDPHAEAISDDVLLQDPTISIADRREGRWWIKEFDAKYRAAALAPKSPPVPVVRDTSPIEPYQVRPTRWKSLMFVLIAGPITLLLLAGWMLFGWLAER